MSHRLSSLQLAILTDRELDEKIVQTFTALKERDELNAWDAPDHKLYQSLKNEQNRRKIVAQIAER